MTPTISQCSGENAPSNGTLRAYGGSSGGSPHLGPGRCPEPSPYYRCRRAPRIHDAFCRIFSMRSTP